MAVAHLTIVLSVDQSYLSHKWVINGWLGDQLVALSRDEFATEEDAIRHCRTLAKRTGEPIIRNATGDIITWGDHPPGGPSPRHQP